MPIIFSDLTKKRGVTLFEVLVAIIIFGVGILTIFSLIINNITWIETIKQKNTATMLAKEGLDIVYNLRDANFERGVSWDCVDFDTSKPDNCGGKFYTGGSSLYGGNGVDYVIHLDMNGTGTNTYILKTVSSESEGLLYFHTGNVATTGASIMTGFWYNHKSLGGRPSIYTRIITFFPSPDYPANTGNILGITSRVIINTGNKKKEIVLESSIGCIFGEGNCS